MFSQSSFLALIYDNIHLITNFCSNTGCSLKQRPECKCDSILFWFLKPRPVMSVRQSTVVLFFSFKQNTQQAQKAYADQNEKKQSLKNSINSIWLIWPIGKSCVWLATTYRTVVESLAGKWAVFALLPQYKLFGDFRINNNIRLILDDFFTCFNLWHWVNVKVAIQLSVCESFLLASLRMQKFYIKKRIMD